MKFFISKYALSGVIQELDCDIKTHGDTRYASTIDRTHGFFKIGTDAHETIEDAIASAEKAKVRKIESLKKQIAKLEKVTFDVNR